MRLLGMGGVAALWLRRKSATQSSAPRLASPELNALFVALMQEIEFCHTESMARKRQKFSIGLSGVNREGIGSVVAGESGGTPRWSYGLGYLFSALRRDIREAPPSKMD
jgi:hypothetical protein